MPPIDQQRGRRRRPRPRRSIGQGGAAGRGADTIPTPAGPPKPTGRPRWAPKPKAGPPAPRPKPQPTWTPKPKSPSPAFRPPASQSKPLGPQRERARQRTRRARSKLPAEPRVPYRPRVSERVARARRVALSPAFRPITSQNEPLQVQRSRSAHQTRAARGRLPDHPDIPEVEGLFLRKHLDELDHAYKRARLKAANAPDQKTVREAQDDYRRAVKKLTDAKPEDLIAEIRDAYKKAARKLGGSSISDLYEYGSTRQRRQMKRVGRIVGEFERNLQAQVAQETGIPVGRDRVAPKPLPEVVKAAFVPDSLPTWLKSAASEVGQFLDQETRLPNKSNLSIADVAGIPLQLGIATLEDPGSVAKSSARTAVEMVMGIPQGVKELVTNTGGALEAIGADYERRYGPIANNPALFRERVKHESGLTPFILDAATLGVPLGRGATMLARSGPAGRAVAALARIRDTSGRLRYLADFAESTHRAARASRDVAELRALRGQLRRAERAGDTRRQAELRTKIRDAEANVAATARPALRFSGGEGGVRAQRSSPNLIIGVGQRALDRSRTRASTRTAERAGWRVGVGGRYVDPTSPPPGAPPLPPPPRGSLPELARTGALRPGSREVIPKTSGFFGRSARELPGVRKYTGRVARDLGGEQSVNRIRLLTHRGRVLNQIDRALRKLDENESAALKYMLQLGATPDQAGVNILRARRAQIEAARAEQGTRIAPILASTNDELALIDEILFDPAMYLTPKSRAVADELRDLQLREARRDPELTADQELIRRMTPQGRALGIERAPDADFFRGVLQQIEASRVDDAGRPLAPGIAAFADELADMRPADRGARARELLRGVKGVRGDRGVRGQRKQAERDVDTARVRLARAEELLRTQERRGRPYEDAAVRAARAELSSARRALRGLYRAAARAEGRRGRVAGRLGEREARGRPIATPEVREARAAVSAADKAVNALERQLARAEERASQLQGRTEGRFAAGRMTEGAGRAAADQAEVVGELQASLAAARNASRAARDELAAVERAAPRITPKEFQDRTRAGNVSEDLQRQIDDAEQRVRDAHAGLDVALGKAPRVTPRQVALKAQRERELAAARATRDHVREFEKALKQVERAAKSKSTMRLEDAVQFADRVRQAADDAGLVGPAYWWSSLYPKQMPSLAASGRGTRAAHRNKPYKGTLFHIGAEETSPDVFTRGVERNIKRRFQQALVARNMETHAYEWSRGSGHDRGRGLTIAELEKAMIERAIDPSTVDFVDPQLLKARYSEEPGLERGRVIDNAEEAALRAAELDPTMPDPVSTTQQDLAAARRRWEEIRNDERLRHAQMRFVAVPREVGETLEGLASGMDNKFWRGLEIVLKQKPARILLGAANVPWLAFQVASNGLLTGLGGGVNPMNIHGAHKWWKGLTPDEKEAIEAELGITHGHHFGMDQPHLGATNSRMINFWRAYKKTKTGRLGTRVNPLNIMFRADEAQNNFFRRVLFYDKSRKAAYRRMGQSWKGIDRGITRLTERVLAQPPGRMASEIARHGEDFEAVAKHVNNFLGDYMRFTPSERFLLQRNIMFYGYLRFSLRFAFYTMPVGHPIMANILTRIGQMGADEIKKLMGVPKSYALPASMMAQAYFGDRDDAKEGNLRSVNWGRMNPFANALTQLDGAQQAVGLVSPIYQALVDQMFEESSFTGNDWRIGGRPTPSETERPENYFGHRARARILAADLLNLAYPYRLASKVGIPGVVDPLAPNQSDDALLFSPRPMMYADKEAMEGVSKTREEFAAEGFGEKLFRELLPMTAGVVPGVDPARTAAPAAVARELEREASVRERNLRAPGERKRRKRRRKRSRPDYGARYGGRQSAGSRYGGG